MGRGRLYVVATPIGNLEDISFRAVETLKKVDLIACEDTRQTRKLLNRFGITTQCTSYHARNEITKADYIVGRVERGEDVAIVSDAGTPGISDPGYLLVRMLADKDAEIIPIPGASALISSLSISGIDLKAFSFYGFLPRKKKARGDFFCKLRAREETLIFFESPHRILQSISEMADAFGSRRAVVCRELTKIHEEVMRGTLPDILDRMKRKESSAVKGEFTIIIEKGERKPACQGEIPIYEEFKRLVDESGLEPRKAIKVIAREKGIPKGTIYREILKKEGKLGK